MKWTAVLIKELKIYLRDKNALVQLFVMPVLVITLANFAMQKIYDTGSQGMVAVPVADMDQTDTSRRLIEEIGKTGMLRLEERYSQGGQSVPMTETLARELIAERRGRTAAIVIPKGFQAALLADRRAELRLLENPLEKIDPMIAKSVLSVVSGRIAGAGTGEPAIGWGASHVAVKTESALAKPVENMSALKQNVPGFAIMFALFSLVWGAMSIVIEREHGTFARLLAAPISKLEILAGKLSMMFLITCTQLAVFFGFGHVVFGMPLGNLAGLILLSMTLAFTTTSLGVFLASFAKTQMQLGVVSSVLILGMSALGGSWWPLEFMPEFMQKLAHWVTINAWAMDGYKNLLWYGGNMTSVLPQVGLLSGFGLVAFLLGIWKFRFE